MRIAYAPYQLELRNPFSISNQTRTSTPLILLRITEGDFHGYGEASMVPYMGENPSSAIAFLKLVDWNRFKFPFDFDDLTIYLDSLAPGQPAIKAAIDIALHDLNSKILNIPCYEYFNADLANMPATSLTIGIDTPDIIRQKVAEARDFKILKIKLGRENDRELIETVRSVSNQPLFIDANQGWTDKAKAIDFIYWLHSMGALLIEQPMSRDDLAGNAWLTARSPIPIIADEAFQRIGDLPQLKGSYHGINIKLMKSAGLTEAARMITEAKKLGMKILIGSMSETSCASLAAASLAASCDWADIDGPWLTTNNPFKTPELKGGKYQLSTDPGLGLRFLPESNSIF